MQRLSAQDSLTVYGEASGWPQHMGNLQVLAPLASGSPLDLGRVREHYQQRLPQLSVFRHRLVKVPAGLDRTVCVDVPDLDVSAHIHGVQLLAPGTDEQLADLVSQLHAPFVDVTRPPWEIWVIEGLPGGRTAVYTKMHHAMVDGERGRAVQLTLLDLDEHGPTGEMVEAVAGADTEVPTNRDLVGKGVLRLGTAPLRLLRTATHVAGTTRRLAKSATRRDLVGLPALGSSPRTRFNARVTPRRAVVFCTLPLGPIKDLGKEHGATVNDVVLSLVGGGLRRYLGSHDELPEESLTALVPIAAADESTGGVPGNKWGVAMATLGSDHEDFVDRLAAVGSSMRAAKAMSTALGTDLFEDFTDVPPAIIALLARIYSRWGLADRLAPVASTNVSNVRGAPVPLYLAGARLEAGYPFGPLADGLGLNVSVMSYDGRLDVGITVCPDRVPDPWALVEALRVEHDTVLLEADSVDRQTTAKRT